MQFLEEEIFEFAETTWQIKLGLDLSSRALPATMGTGARTFIRKSSNFLSLDRVVLLHGSHELAAAAVIFAMALGSGPELDFVDAMFELTNIIGGNTKSLFPNPVSFRCLV